MAEFSTDQLVEIEEGKKSGVDTSVYAKPEYLAIQMRQIRFGLEEGLNVSAYLDPKFDWFQMFEIRLGLEDKINVSPYAKPEVPYEKMRQVRKGLMEGIDLSNCLGFSAGIIKQIRKSKEEKLDISKYIKDGYDADQLYEIRLALRQGINLDKYISTDLRGASIAEIRKGLEVGVDVSTYASLDFNWQQMREIRLGLEDRLTVVLYLNHYYDWKQMREIRLGLKDGLDVTSYTTLMYPSREMRKKRLKIAEYDGQSEISYANENFQITINGGAVDAFVTVKPGAREISRETLLDVLEENGITHGIIEETIEKITSGNFEEGPMHIAQGTVPKKGQDGYYEFFFNTDAVKKPKILEDGSTDYSNVEWFTVVKEGDTLAVYHDAEEGTDGYTVTGEVLHAKKGLEHGILKGTGFVLSEDQHVYKAEMDGMVTLRGDILEVTRHLELPEVSMATGNVDFDGSIHVKGNVENGASIHATEDIVIDGNVGGAEIVSEGKIVLNKGMNAGRRGKVKAEKGVISKFFENVLVLSEGDIEVNTSLNSTLRAKGRIISSNAIIGGKAFASRGYKIHHAGNEAGVKTQLSVGIDDSLIDRSGEVKSRIAENRKQLNILENSLNEMKIKFPPEVRNAMPTFIKIEDAIYTINKRQTELEREKEAINREILYSRESVINISGKAYDGCTCVLHKGKWEASGERGIVLKGDGNKVAVVG